LKRKYKAKQVVKRILRFALLTFCGLLLGINVYLANAKTLVGNQLPMPFGVGAAVVLSGSMEPEFSKGDLIFVKEETEYDLNDIVVYQSEGSLVVHRIIEKDGGFVTTKGDANNVADDPVPLTAVKGRVLFWIPMLGTVVGFLKSPIGFICTIAAAIALIEIPRRNEKKKDEEEREKILEEIKRLKDENYK